MHVCVFAGEVHSPSLRADTGGGGRSGRGTRAPPGACRWPRVVPRGHNPSLSPRNANGHRSRPRQVGGVPGRRRPPWEEGPTKNTTRLAEKHVSAHTFIRSSHRKKPSRVRHDSAWPTRLPPLSPSGRPSRRRPWIGCVTCHGALAAMIVTMMRVSSSLQCSALPWSKTLKRHAAAPEASRQACRRRMMLAMIGRAETKLLIRLRVTL